MNYKTRIRHWTIFFIAALILAFIACQKKKPPAEEMLPMDRVAPSPVGTTQTVLHKTFVVGTSSAFPFEIPPHAAMPHLHGTYKSYVKQLSIQTNDDSTNVDFLILNEDQHAEFVQGHPSEALFSAAAAHDQEVNVSLPASQDQPQKYYLIFRNAPGGEAKKVVQADFTVDF